MNKTIGLISQDYGIRQAIAFEGSRASHKMVYHLYGLTLEEARAVHSTVGEEEWKIV